MQGKGLTGGMTGFKRTSSDLLPRCPATTQVQVQLGKVRFHDGVADHHQIATTADPVGFVAFGLHGDQFLPNRHCHPEHERSLFVLAIAENSLGQGILDPGGLHGRGDHIVDVMGHLDAGAKSEEDVPDALVVLLPPDLAIAIFGNGRDAGGDRLSLLAVGFDGGLFALLFADFQVRDR